MGTRQHQEFHFESSKRGRGKVFLACMRCRERRVRCDGKSPECSRCIDYGLQCEYVAVRRMRGPGKKKNSKKAGDKVNIPDTETQSQNKDGLKNYEDYQRNAHGELAMLRACQPAEPGAGASGDATDLQARIRQVFPAFLHPENQTRTLQALKRGVQENQKSPEGFAALVSQDMLRFVLDNTFDEITGLCPIFDLPTLKRLNAEQQAVDGTHPAGNPARWAILSTWIAMSMHLRTVLGSEDEFDDFIKSYYHNAVLVLPELILQPANLEAIRALLFMAVFADGIQDHRSFVMLVTNAARQMELLAPRLSAVSDRGERESCRQLLSFARSQEREVSEKFGLTLILKSVSV